MYKEQMQLTIAIAVIAILGGMLSPEFLNKVGIGLPVIWIVGVIAIQIFKKSE